MTGLMTLALAVLTAGILLDLTAAALWLHDRNRRAADTDPDWSEWWPTPLPVPAAMLTTGLWREYGDLELARRVRAVGALNGARCTP